MGLDGSELKSRADADRGIKGGSKTGTESSGSNRRNRNALLERKQVCGSGKEATIVTTQR